MYSRVFIARFKRSSARPTGCPVAFRIEASALGLDRNVPWLAASCPWGPVARKFFRECLALADDDRDIDLYHWSSAQFSAVWSDTLSVLVARGRAQISVAAAVTDWPKRIRDMRYVDHEDYGGID